MGTRGAGFLYLLADDRPSPVFRREVAVKRLALATPRRDFGELAERLRLGIDDKILSWIVQCLPGVSPKSLYRLRAGWNAENGAAVFPMSDGSGRIIGLRYRSPSGGKWAATGSRNGLFVPEGLQPKTPLFLPGGPTDAAAVLSLGVQAVGRPSAVAGVDLVAELVRRIRPSLVIVVADQDEVGRRGAGVGTAAAALCPTAIWTPPTKDLREFAAVDPVGAARELELVTGETTR